MYSFNVCNVCNASTFSVQLESMDTMERHTDVTERAGDQSSVRIDKQM